jgi:archaellum component FlaC
MENGIDEQTDLMSAMSRKLELQKKISNMKRQISERESTLEKVNDHRVKLTTHVERIQNDVIIKNFVQRRAWRSLIF